MSVDVKFFNRAFDEKALKIPESVFHYTSIGGLMGIIENSQFYVSRSDVLNDTSEIVYFWEVYDDVFADLKKKARNNGSEGFLNYLEWSKEYVERARADKDGWEKSFEVFALSFSRNHDSLLLWANYASKDGYNIEFNSRELAAALEKNIKFCRFGNIIYDRTEQKKIIEKEIRETYEHHAHIITKMGWNSVFSGLFFYRMYVWMMFFKNELFKQEEEFRIAFLRNSKRCIHENELENFHDIMNCPTKYRSKEALVVPYVEMNFDSKIIKRITIGPTNKASNAYAGLNDFLYSKKIEAKIEQSKIPLRY